MFVLLANLLLGGELLRFEEGKPQFSGRQVHASDASVREGLLLWAATEEGRAILERMRDANIEITIVEDAQETGPGRAPQPAIGTMLAAADRNKLKRYELILNPALAQQYEQGDDAIALGEPTTPAGVMAAAWAAEMLHIDFYARGIPLPHHERGDFQSRWRKAAEQLGFPLLLHTTEHR
jgi:hypothetical protein